MKILAVEDEPKSLTALVKHIEEAEPKAEVAAFQKAKEALEYTKDHAVDVAFLDIKMRVMNGLELAKRIKISNPKTNIIFCTGYSEYALEAIQDVRCSGYVMKPVSTEDIRQELDDLRVPVSQELPMKNKVYIQCFGNFEIFCNGQPVLFARKKTKELMAYLVDNRGAMCNKQEILVALWEDNQNHSDYLKKIKKDLKDTLKKYDILDIISMKINGSLGIVRKNVECDYYQWLDETPEGIRIFNGKYMEQYTWAEHTKAQMLKI